MLLPRRIAEMVVESECASFPFVVAFCFSQFNPEFPTSSAPCTLV